MEQVTLSLEALDSTDIGLIRSWRNNYEIWRWCRQVGPISDAEQVRWFNRQSEDPTIRMYKLAVRTEKEIKAVGVAGLTSIDQLNRRAEFSLYVCPEMQRHGLGKRFLSLLFAHGFDHLGLNVIWGETFDQNPAAKMFEKLGMLHEGTRRQFYWRDGRFIDAHLYSITAEDWYGREMALGGAAPDAGDERGGEPAPALVAPLPIARRPRGRKPKGGYPLPPGPQGPGAA